MQFLALLFGDWVFRPYSFLVSILLRLRGVSVGKNFKILGVPQLRLLGGRGSIQIGNNVFIKGSIDLRTGPSGKILIGDHVAIDTNCRFIAANDSVLTISGGADLGCYLICNCGTDVTIGADVLMGGFCHIQSSSHDIAPGLPIKHQSHSYAPITIGDGCWLGSHVTVLKGIVIGEGSVVGAKSVVTKDVSPNSIVAGVPASFIRFRSVG